MIQPSATARPRTLTEHIRAATPLGVLIFAYILVGVGRVHEHFSFLSPLHPGLVTFFLVVGYVVLNPAAIDLSNVWTTWPGRVIVILGVCAGLSGVFGLSLGAVGMFVINEFAPVLVFAVIMVSAVGRLPLLRAVMLAFVMSGAFWLYIAYFVASSSTFGVVNGIRRLDIHYTYDPNDFCVILNTALPLSILFFRTSANRWLRWGALAVALGVPGAVALSGSRGGLLGLIATTLALMLLVREVSVGKKLGGVFVALLALMVMAPEGYWNQMGTMLDVKEDYNWTDPTGRRQIFMRGLGYVMRYPFFGVGANQFSRAEGTIGPLARNHVPGTALPFLAPHNTPLQVAADMGIPALLAWLSVVFIGLFWLPKQRRRLDRHSEDPDERFLYQACTYLPAAWAGFGVSVLFVSFAYLVPYYIMLAYTVGIMLALRRRESGEWVASEPTVGLLSRAEWRSRRAQQATPLWDPRVTARNSATLKPGDGFAQER